MAETHHGMVNINEQVQRKKLMFEFKHPKYYKELKKNLTKENFSDKGEEDEKIQSKINRTRDRGSSDNTIRGRANIRKNRK